MRIFLRLRHWQLLVVLIAPLLLEFAISNDIVSVAQAADPIAAIARYQAMRALPLLLMAVVWLTWVYTIGKYCCESSHFGIGKSERQLFVFAFVLTLSITVISACSWWLPFSLFWLVPVAQVTIMYMLWFAASVLHSAAATARIDFSGGKLYLMGMLWAFPLGIWDIQSRVNELARRFPPER